MQGNASLSGEIVPQGAKNEALQVMCATLLTPEKVRINNLPDIRDVKRLMEILIALGVEVTPIDRNTYEFQARDINFDYLQSQEFVKVSGAIRAFRSS